MEQFNAISPQDAKTKALEMTGNLAIGALNSLLCDWYLTRVKCKNDQNYVFTVEVCDLIAKMREMFFITAFTDDEIHKAFPYHQITKAYREVGWSVWCEQGFKFEFRECNTDNPAT